MVQPSAWLFALRCHTWNDSIMQTNTHKHTAEVMNRKIVSLKNDILFSKAKVQTWSRNVQSCWDPGAAGSTLSSHWAGVHQRTDNAQTGAYLHEVVQTFDQRCTHQNGSTQRERDRGQPSGECTSLVLHHPNGWLVLGPRDEEKLISWVHGWESRF